MKKPWIGKTIISMLTILFIPVFYLLQTWVENFKNTHYNAMPLFIWYFVWTLLLCVLIQFDHLRRLLSRGKAAIRVDRLVVTLGILAILVLGYYPFGYILRSNMAPVVLILFWSSALRVFEKKETATSLSEAEPYS